MLAKYGSWFFAKFNTRKASENKPINSLACEQAHRGALVAGWQKGGELATTSLEFEYLHRKSQCKMLIGRDDISNDIITLGTRFSMSVYICADGQKSDSSVDGKPQGNWRWNSNSGDLQALLPFPAPPPERPGELAHRLLICYWTSLNSILFHKDTKNNLTNNIQPFWPHAWQHAWLIAQSIWPVRVVRRLYTNTYFPGRSSQTISSKPIMTWPSRIFFPRTKFAILCWAPLTPAENPTGKGAMPDTDECGCITTCSNTCRKPSLMASTASESSVVTAMFIDWSLPPVKNKALNLLRLKFPWRHDHFAVLLCP